MYCLVILVALAAICPLDGVAVVEVRLIAYNNPKGKNRSTFYCDTIKTNRCDHRLTLCLDRLSNPLNTDANKCSVERLVSPEYRDQNVILFTNGLTIAGAMDRWEGSVMFKVHVLEIDSLVHDDVDDLYAVLTVPSPSSVHNKQRYVKVITGLRPVHPTTLSFDYAVYCDNGWTGLNCDQLITTTKPTTTTPTTTTTTRSTTTTIPTTTTSTTTLPTTVTESSISLDTTGISRKHITMQQFNTTSSQPKPGSDTTYLWIGLTIGFGVMSVAAIALGIFFRHGRRCRGHREAETPPFTSQHSMTQQKINTEDLVIHIQRTSSATQILSTVQGSHQPAGVAPVVPPACAGTLALCDITQDSTDIDQILMTRSPTYEAVNPLPDDECTSTTGGSPELSIVPRQGVALKPEVAPKPNIAQIADKVGNWLALSGFAVDKSTRADNYEMDNSDRDSVPIIAEYRNPKTIIDPKKLMENIKKQHELATLASTNSKTDPSPQD